jgi:Na+-driven multidrug efflux pump
MAENLVKQESYFTRREWILRYSSPFKSLMFMAGPMIIIMIVNSMYGIIDKQLVLNFAVNEVAKALNGEHVNGYPAIWSPNVLNGVDNALFAKQLINVSTQYSNTVITIIQALSLFTSVGTGIRFGQAMGARDRDRMNNIVISGFIQTSILIVISTVVLSQIYPYILTSQAGIAYADRGTSWQFALSDEYAQMFVFGIPLLGMSNFFITLLRTEGKVWIVIFNNIACVILNVIFGTVFMEIMDLGMKGAVYGSMVSWGISITVSVCVIAFSKDTFLRPNFKRFVFSTHDALRIWVVGLSPLLVNIVFAVVSYISTILITNMHDYNSMYGTAMNTWLSGAGVDAKQIVLPTDPALHTQVKDALDHYIFVCIQDKNGNWVVTEHISDTLRIMSSANPWMTLIYAPIIGMSQGANVNYAYNIGANKRERIVQIYKIHLLINICWLIFAEILVNSAAEEMMAMFCFVGDNYYWFQIYLAPMIFASLTFTTISLFQGLGNPKDALVVSISRAFLIQITFIVIGWWIAKESSTDGSKDWAMFLMNGLQEIPAFALAAFMLLRKFKNWKTTGILIDAADNFEKPSLGKVVYGEFMVAQDKQINALNEKLKRFKEKNKDEKLIAEQEKLVAFEIESIKFRTLIEMSISIAKNKINEAKGIDKKNYANAKFNKVQVVEEALTGIQKTNESLDQVNIRIKKLQDQFAKASAEEQKQKLFIVISKEIKKLIKEKSKAEKAIVRFTNDEAVAKNKFEKRNAYFIAHKDEVLAKLKIKNDKREAKRLAYIRKQDENKTKYEKRLQENPKMLEHINKHKEKIIVARQKEEADHNKRTEKFESILARREQKRQEKISRRG